MAYGDLYLHASGDYRAAHSDWQYTWLGAQVTFKLGGQTFQGEVIETDDVWTASGIHQIVTVELFDGRHQKQVKVQLHRQACKIVQPTTLSGSPLSK